MPARKSNTEPLFSVAPTQMIKATIQLDNSTALLVEQYAAYATTAPDAVINKALSYAFSRDASFQDYLQSGHAPTGLSHFTDIRRRSSKA
ncbi:MAG: hypothetical protein FWD64_02775 [Acidobacteriaceae bacterium]|nr:hypothetical protein [Acidobacteriaceae bacterium]